ncbi:hypothetical protein BJ546DRAFT_836803 [Cryomyces antarcticus]
MPRMPIAIIGAGLGGLTLGRCLKQKDIPFTIYEKAASPSRHSYGITLCGWSYQPLLQALKVDEHAFRHLTSVDRFEGTIGHISRTSLVFTMDSDASASRVHRGRFESFLREGLDIKHGYELIKLELSQQNVTGSFHNGHQIEGCLLVGADGVHSQVRKTCLPECQPNVFPFVVFNGRRRLSRDIFQDLYEPHMGEANLLETLVNNVLLQISVNDRRAGDENVEISYTFSRSAISQDPLHRPDRAVNGATDIPEEFYAEVEALPNLPQPFADAFDMQKVRQERLLHWLMRGSLTPRDDLERLAEQSVILMGDAAHAMPIIGGDGGNAVIEDAVTLAEWIADNGTEDISRYYETRYRRWRSLVDGSARRLAEMHDEPKSVL